MKISIKTTARIGGILYLAIIFAGIFSEMFVRGKFIVAGNATATATNIMASQSLWRMGIASDLLMHICDVPLVLILYMLLKPVNKNLALLAMLFTLIQTAVLVAFKLNLFMSLLLLSDANYLKALEPHQLQALSYAFIRSDAYGFSFGLLFFGFACLVIGYLIIKSGYFPKLIGVLMQIGGLCYIINSFALILAPKFADILFPSILLPSFIAEISFCLWLIVKGVNVPKWEKRVNNLAAD
jgi:Domain of unknown function (DUF4386)